jgi:NAD(P)-dependent dehydrogenase (short-subunit alcohol dehydrogenase family)
MRQQATGRIVNIGSVAGFVPMPFQAVYAATKHALAGWTETLDFEVRPFGIRASGLSCSINALTSSFPLTLALLSNHWRNGMPIATIIWPLAINIAKALL